jgi:hypothetical protein
MKKMKIIIIMHIKDWNKMFNDTPDGVPANSLANVAGLTEKASNPRQHVVAGFKQLHPHVVSKIVPDDPNKLEDILLRLGKLARNNDERWVEGRVVNPSHSHEVTKASSLPWIRFGIHNGSGELLWVDEQDP